MPTLRIPDDIWEKAVDAAVDATIIRRKPVQATEVLRFCLAQSISESSKDFVAQEKVKKEKK